MRKRVVRRKYDNDIHAKRLLKVLELKKPCGKCPAAPRYNSGVYASTMWVNSNYATCALCYDFIHGEGAHTSVRPPLCVCKIYPTEKAVSMAWEALKRRGYLKDAGT